MTLTPDRKREGQNERDDSAFRSVAAAGGGESECTGPTYKELLNEAGLDLSNHPLGDMFDKVAELPEEDEVRSQSRPDQLIARDALEAIGTAKLSEPREPAELCELTESLGQSEASGRPQPQPQIPRPESQPEPRPESQPEPRPETQPQSGESAGNAESSRWGGRSLWDASAYDPEAAAEVQRLAAELDAEKEAWMQAKAEEKKAKRDAEFAAYMETPEYRAEVAEEEAERRRIKDEWARKKEDEARSAREKIERQHEALKDLGPAPAEGLIGGGIAGEPESEQAHQLLDQYDWSDLKRIVPELAGSIEDLRTLLGELHSFTRPMGPDDAVTVLDGLETLGRLTESLSVVTLSVFERVGTPKDYGAKTTQALVQNRLNVSEREAKRRADLAKDLGKQVNYSGQSIEPRFAVVSAGLLEGVLSATQASTIINCLKDLPCRASEEQCLEAERILVEKAPTVRVRDIYVLFKEILAWIDPDGECPEEAPSREDFFVHLRQSKDGTWSFKGKLDAQTGGVMNGFLTSRIKTEDEKSGRASGADTCVDSATDSTSTDQDKEVVDTYTEVLRGDRSDARDPSLDFTIRPDLDDGMSRSSAPTGSGDAEIPAGVGVREDGSMIAMADKQPSVRRRIYERFSSMINGVEMDRVKAGSPYALVVTAKAEDLARQSGRATTGAEAPFPIRSAALEGLNGSVFFHLMGEKTKTMQVATEGRFATSKQLVIISSRDQGCTFPGCDTPPGWCDAHHIVPWAEGGRTDINNLTLACGAHHHLIDQTDWYAVMLKDGRPAWIPPASIDPARRPVFHARFIAREIGDTLFD